MNYRSHTKEEVIEALKQGKKVFALDTGNYGEDDVLIGGTMEEALADVLSHQEWAELPEGWELREISCPTSCKANRGKPVGGCQKENREYK